MKLTKSVLGLLLALAMVVGCLPALDVSAAENSNYTEVLQPSSGYPESDHNYANNLNKTYTYRVEGAAYLKLTFSTSTLMENNYDYLSVYTGADVLVGQYTGSALAGTTVKVDGDTVKIKIVSDGTVGKYGFKLTSVYAGFYTFTSLTINTLPTKLMYTLNSTVDLSGIAAEAVNATGGVVELTADQLTVISADTSTIGKKTVTVGYENVTAQFDIYVHQGDAGEYLQDQSGYPESEHNYDHDEDITYTYTVPGAKYLKITFSASTVTEANYDFIILYDGAETMLGKYSGTTLASTTHTIEGDTVKIRLTSDDDTKKFGFALTSIYAYIDRIVHEEADAGVYTPHTCTQDAYTTLTCKICGETWTQIHEGTAAHTWDEGVYTQSQCLKDGYTTYTCTVCGVTNVEQAPGTATGHTLDEGIYTQPDCFADGYTTQTCQVCGATVVTQDACSAFHTFEDGYCITCGVPEGQTNGGWLSDTVYWAMLPGNVLYFGGSGEIPSNAQYRSAMSAATSVVFGEGITALGNSALYGLTKLTSVKIPDTVTSIGNLAFYGCTGLKTVFIPKSVTTISASSYANAPFYGCSSTLKLYCEVDSAPSGWNTAWYSYKYYSGYYWLKTYFSISPEGYSFWIGLDTSMTSVTIPDHITEIPGGIFQNYDSLTTINFGNGVTKIGANAFSNCDNLKTVVIGSSVKEIGANAFYACPKLEYVYIPSTVETMGDGVFLSCNVTLKLFCEAEAAGENWAAQWHKYGYSNSSVVNYLYVNYAISRQEFDYWSTLNASATVVEIAKGITTIPAYAFNGFSSLRTVTMPESLTTIQARAFYDLNTLSSVSFGFGVTTIGEEAFYHCDALTTVAIDWNVQTLGARAFYQCNALSSVFVGGKVTYIQPETFEYCGKLKSVTIGDSVTHIEESAFYYCSTMTTLTMGSGVQSIGKYAFYNCDGLTTVILGDSVTYIESLAFNDCSNLTVVYIPATVSTIVAPNYYSGPFYTCNANLKIYTGAESQRGGWGSYWNYRASNSPLTVLYNVPVAEYDLWAQVDLTAEVITLPAGITVIPNNFFKNVTTLKSITLPSTVTTIGDGAFYGCTALAQITIPESVTTIEQYAFYGCTALVEIDIPNGVTEIGAYTFYNCTSLTQVTVPEGVTIIGRYAFAGCTGLKTLTLPASLTKVDTCGFNQCSALEEVHISDLSAWFGIAFTDAAANPLGFGDLYVAGQKLTQLVIPENVTVIPAYAFYGASITGVTIHANLVQIGIAAFDQCVALEVVCITDLSAWCNIDFGNANSSPLRYGKLYCNGELLTRVEIPGDVTTLKSFVFSYSALEAVTIPASVTTVQGNAFYNSTNLTEVHIEDLQTWCSIDFGNSSANPTYYAKGLHLNGEKLTELTIPENCTYVGSYAFVNCLELTAVTIPQGIMEIHNGAFMGCDGLTTIALPESVTSIGNSAFYDCSSLETVTMTDSVKSIGSYAFYWCSALKEIRIPKDLVTIRDYAFYYCTSLTELTIPEPVFNIMNYAFAGCTGVKQIYFQGAPAIGNYAFRNVTAQAYYPYDNENWTSSDFADYGGTLTWDYYSLAGTLAEGTCGAGVNWSLDQAGTLFITGTGEMDAYSTSNGITTAPWGAYAGQITRVIVGNGVTMMGQFAFYGLEGLTGISFWGDRPEFAAYAFSGVNTTVDYKANNTTWIPSELGKYGGNILWKPSEMSEGYIAYSSLTSTYSYWRLDHQGTLTLYNYSGSYSIGGAPWYDYRYHIKKVVVKGYEDVSQYAFYNCTELTELVIEGSTDGIGTSAFENCTKLKKVNLGSYMISIGNYAFSGCTSLESIYVQPYPNLKIGNYAFYCCTGLKEVSIPGNVTLGTQAFGSCSKLNTIYINENCYGGNFSAQSNTFSGVTANVYYPEGSWSYSNPRNQNYGGALTWMSVYFGSCGIDAKWNYNVDTKELTITGSGTVSRPRAGGRDMPWGPYVDEILSIRVESGITYLQSYVFEYCSKVTSIILPETIEGMDLSAFNDCASLNNLILPASLKSINGHSTAFVRCGSLTDVYYFGTTEEWQLVGNYAKVTSYQSQMTIHFLEWIPDSATCTEDGYEAHYQYDDTSVYNTTYDANKKVIYQLKVIPKFGHSYKTVTVDATCTVDGSITDTCATCGDVQVQVLTAPGHSYDPVVTDPTCTEPGYTTYTCTVCGDVCVSDETAALDHSFTDYVSNNDATCEADGTETAKCDRCDEVHTRQAVGSGGHLYTNYVSNNNAGCLYNGTETAYCDRCGAKHTRVEANSAKGHSFTNYVYNEDAACEADGTETAKCDRCTVTDTRTAENSALGHSFTNYISDGNATCVEAGTQTAKCDRCDATDTKELAATGHSFTHYVSDGNVTCTETGTQTAQCDHCDATDTKELAATGHDLSQWYVITAPTCTTAGENGVTCPYCGLTQTETVDPLGHSFTNYISHGNATCEADGTWSAKCDRCDAEDTQVQQGSALGHSFTNYVSHGNATCEADGTWSATCDHCGIPDTQVEEGSALGHSFTNYVSDGNTTCTENGTKTAKCDRCDEMNTIEEEAFGHSFENGTCGVCGEIDPDYTKPVVQPILTPKAPTLEFKDMINIIVFYTAENLDDVVEMGMITYCEKVTEWNVETANHVIPGASYEAGSGRYYSASQGIHAKYLGDTVYLALYAKLSDGSYAYSKLVPYSPITYASNQLKNSTNTGLKQLVAAMLNYGAAAQLYFGHNTDALANAGMTEEQLALPEGYRADMIQAVPTADQAKQGIFYNNKGFSKRSPAVSFEGAFSINYWFTPAYTPVGEITCYYWYEADLAAAEVLTPENASGSFAMELQSNGQYRGDMTGIAAKDLAKAIYVAAVYTDGTDTWTSGVLGYSLGAYCASQASKGGTMGDLAMATAVYGYHAKAYFG